MAKKKKKLKDTDVSVLTGHDEKAERESADRSKFRSESDRPNGCSGNYS